MTERPRRIRFLSTISCLNFKHERCFFLRQSSNHLLKPVRLPKVTLELAVSQLALMLLCSFKAVASILSLASQFDFLHIPELSEIRLQPQDGFVALFNSAIGLFCEVLKLFVKHRDLVLILLLLQFL